MFHEQLYDLRLVLAHASASKQKSHLRMGSGHHGGGLEKVGMIFHGIKSRDQAYENCFIGNSQLGANQAAGLFVGTKHLAIEAVGNHDSFSSLVPNRFVVPRAGLTVVNDSPRVPGEEGAEPDGSRTQPGLRAKVMK